MKATVSEKGQVTIPKKLRDSLGIRPGQIVEMREDRGRIVVTKAPARQGLDRVFGILKLGRSTDELIEELRGPPDPP